MTPATTKIYHPVTQQVLAEIFADKVIFHNQALEEALVLTGIVIPAPQRKEYEGKGNVFPNDPLFPKAFKEIYYPNCLKESGMITSDKQDRHEN